MGEGAKELTSNSPLHTQKILRRATFNRLYMAVYAVAIIAHLYHHLFHMADSHILLFFSDIILSFMWVCTQSCSLRPIRRQEFPEMLLKQKTEIELPAVDIFICTADPYKEPPMGTVNTALSVMAYDYPPEKVSVYVSDDGGSQFTLFAFMEAAKFARHWLPFCKDNNITVRCPEAYFASTSNGHGNSQQAIKLQKMYESLKARVEYALEKGKVEKDVDGEMRRALSQWTTEFTPQTHPTIIQVILAGTKDKDISGGLMPNLIYFSREKSKAHDHRFKAGALNALVRVSATMTNSPIILTLDCDTYSNDPETIKRAVCYFSDTSILPTLAYVQFPQIFRSLSKGDLYHSEHKRLYVIHPMGMDGLRGPNYVGTGCFFQRRAFFGSPSSIINPGIIELDPTHLVKSSITSSQVLELAYQVAVCDYEQHTGWGTKWGFRYGSLSEDYHTGYKMHCEGWKSIFCHPVRPAFLGDSPITLIDLLGQCKRWINGLLGVICSNYSTITFGVRYLGLVVGLALTQNSFWPFHTIPLTIYAFIPPIALINGISVFPKVSDSWFNLYMFLFIGVNAKDMIDFVLEKGTLDRWWNSQRMWMISGVTCYLFGCIEYTLKCLGISAMSKGFDVTSKVEDEELRKRYDKDTFEFGVASPMFVTITMVSLLNLVAFLVGLIGIFYKGFTNMEGLILQILLSGFLVLNSWPIYQAMVFRSDKGRLPLETTMTAAILASFLCILTSAFLY